MQVNTASFYSSMLLFRVLAILFLLKSMVSLVTADDDDPVLFKNDYITCYSDRLVIPYYYFPYGSKTVKYKNIRSVELLDAKDLSFFQTKTWGMALSSIWWPLDIRRQWRKHYLVIDANQWPKIGITMNDEDTIKVYNLIRPKILS